MGSEPNQDNTTMQDEKQALMGKPLSKEEAAYLLEEVEKCSKLLQEAQAEIATEVWGQDEVIKLTITCAVASGHLLAVGVPGLAKTRLVERFAKVMGLESERIQFTPDLMPSDILGSEIQDQDENGKFKFTFMKGPLFTQYLMADEINRAGPRTQAALLQAMQERKVTVAGDTYHLKRPFTVMATQNPLEQEGTYPLPEAQLDRFLMKVDFDYPDYESEKKMLYATTSSSADIRELRRRAAAGEDLSLDVDTDEQSKVRQILDKNDLIIMQKVARKLPISEDVADAILSIVRQARPTSEESDQFIKDNVAWGPGPRASQAFALAAKAHALMDGRPAPDISDVLAVADTVLEHRMALTFGARADGVTFKDVKEHLVLKL